MAGRPSRCWRGLCSGEGCSPEAKRAAIRPHDRTWAFPFPPGEGTRPTMGAAGSSWGQAVAPHEDGIHPKCIGIREVRRGPASFDQARGFLVELCVLHPGICLRGMFADPTLGESDDFLLTPVWILDGGGPLECGFWLELGQAAGEGGDGVVGAVGGGLASEPPGGFDRIRFGPAGHERSGGFCADFGVGELIEPLGGFGGILVGPRAHGSEDGLLLGIRIREGLGEGEGIVGRLLGPFADDVFNGCCGGFRGFQTLGPGKGCLGIGSGPGVGDPAHELGGLLAGRERGGEVSGGHWVIRGPGGGDIVQGRFPRRTVRHRLHPLDGTVEVVFGPATGEASVELFAVGTGWKAFEELETLCGIILRELPDHGLGGGGLFNRGRQALDPGHGGVGIRGGET
jgi:hypothetical protein